MHGICVSERKCNDDLLYIENTSGLFGMDQDGVLQYYYCNPENMGCGCTQEKPIVKVLAIPEGVKVIPDDSFRNYTVLWELSFPKTLKAIGAGLGGAFSHCNLPDITFGEELDYLGPWAFAGSSLHSLRLREPHMPLRPENQFQGAVIDNLIHGECCEDSCVIDEYARWHCRMAPKTNWLIPGKSNAYTVNPEKICHPYNESMSSTTSTKGVSIDRSVSVCTSESRAESIVEKKALWNGPVAFSEQMESDMTGVAYDSEGWFRHKVANAWDPASVSLLQHLLKCVVVRKITDGDGRICNLEDWKNRMIRTSGRSLWKL